MPKRHRKRRLWDIYQFPGFRPSATVKGIFGEPGARVIALSRRPKKHSAAAADFLTARGTTGRYVACGISRVATAGSTSTWRFAGFFVAAAGW
jgi:hypothetical protein